MRIDSPTSVITLDRGEYTSCTINIHGATVTSWRIKNKEMIFVARQTHFTSLSHIRGGIQFVFPMLKGWKVSPDGPNLGFARYMTWTVLNGPLTTEDGNVYVTIMLEDNAYTRALWAHKFKLIYKIILHESKIEFYVGVENPSECCPFEFFIVHHSLMKVPDVTQCEIIGFKDCLYRDCLENQKLYRDEQATLTITKQIDRIYPNAPALMKVTNVVNNGFFNIKKKFTADFNVWNPWEEQSKTIVDLGDDEFKKFIAVEAGMISRPVRVEPLSCWKGCHSFEFVNPRKGEMVQDFFDLFNGYC